MTREEAIKKLKIVREDYWDEYGDPMPALDMAIKALEQEPKILNTLDFAIDAIDGDTNYFVGVRNGLRYSKSLIDGKEPQFESCTEQEPCEMTAEEYRQRMIQAFHNADTDELIAICVLPTEKEFEHLEWLLKNHYKKEPCGNAIDRAEAIKVASGYCHPANVAKEHCPHEAKIEPKADTWSIKDVANTFKKHGLIVEQEPCEDCISRQAAIDALSHMMDTDGFRDGWAVSRANVDCMLRSLPSAQPEQRWIPCSERLPKDKTYVLTTIKIPNRIAHVRSGWYEGGFIHNDNGDVWKATDMEVIAWMPLPEPYKTESEDKE